MITTARKKGLRDQPKKKYNRGGKQVWRTNDDKIFTKKKISGIVRIFTLSRKPIFAESVATNVGNILLSQASLLDLENPDIVVKKRGRPAGAKNKDKSTKRDKSLFEHSECSYKCSNCGKPGHRKNKCMNPVVQAPK